MSLRRSTRGFGAGIPDPGGWRRHLDPLAWHTIIGFVAGLTVSAIIGVALNPYGLRSEDDLVQAYEEGFAAGSAAIADQARSDGEHIGYLKRLRRAFLTTSDPPKGAFAESYRRGDFDGRIDALKAMRQVAVEVGLGDDAVEFEVLDEMEGR